MTSPTASFGLDVDVLSTNKTANSHTLRLYKHAIPGTSTSWYGNSNGTIRGIVDGQQRQATNADANFGSSSNSKSKQWGPYDITVPGSSNGAARSIDLSLYINYPSASGSKSGTSTAKMTLPSTLIAPEVPTNNQLSRVNDSALSASFTRQGASHGQATQIQISTQVNDGNWADQAWMNTVGSTTISAEPNRKIVSRVRSRNDAGTSNWSSTSAPVWTTPGAPSSVSIVRLPGNSVGIVLTPTVAYSEHQHVIKHGALVNGSVVWDDGILVALPAGVNEWLDESPDPSLVHVYGIAARTMDTSQLTSAFTPSNHLQLLAAPNPPSFTNLPPSAPASKDFHVRWNHNPVDTTEQTAFELEYSENSGATWLSTGGKTSSDVSQWLIPSWTYPVGTSIMVRVRTWGMASSGGFDGEGGSDWSQFATVTFRDTAIVTVDKPAADSSLTRSTIDVGLTYQQSEGATPIRATIELWDKITNELVETLLSTTLSSTILGTRAINGHTYELRVSVLDSFGMITSTDPVVFTVEYTPPVKATVEVSYLRESGRAQLDISFIEDSERSLPAFISVRRAILPSVEARIHPIWEAVEVEDMTAQSWDVFIDQYRVETIDLTGLIDTTPTIHGQNLYEVTGWGDDGTSITTQVLLTVREDRWAFVSSGATWEESISVYGNLTLGANPGRQQDLFNAADREYPIGMYGPAKSYAIPGSATIVDGEGSTVKQISDFLQHAGRVCYRDPSGHRIFGQIQGSVSSWSKGLATFTYTVTRTGE
jgi:hypothetical protein